MINGCAIGKYGQKGNTMKNFYVVVSKFFDNGTMQANIYIKKAETKPENKMVEHRDFDEYHDYFETRERAEKFRKNTLNA